MSRRALIIEDETDFASIVAMNVNREGFETTIARTGELGLTEARRLRPDVILLDLNLPDISGTEVCRRLKADSATAIIPIIMVTARSEEIDRVVGLELGADDYVVKPVSMRELVLRLKAVLRRQSATLHYEPPSFEIGMLSIDGPGHRVYVGKDEVSLTALEFKLLVALVMNRGRVMTRETLLDKVWGVNAELETRTVDTVTKRLRDKLGPAGRYIETVRGVGYRFSDRD